MGYKVILYVIVFCPFNQCLVAFVIADAKLLSFDFLVFKEYHVHLAGLANPLGRPVELNCHDPVDFSATWLHSGQIAADAPICAIRSKTRPQLLHVNSYIGMITS